MRRVKELIHDSLPVADVNTLPGSGVGIAVLDTGIAEHPDLRNRLSGFCDLLYHHKRIYDDNGHGTHVAGILCGSGKMSSGEYSGMAPGSHVFVVKVLDKKGNGSAEAVIKGMRFVREHAKEYGIRVVNISMGALMQAQEREERRLLRETEELWDSGLVVIAAAGNYGPDAGTITSPGNSRKVITVGAYCDRQKAYSGGGPTRDCICKPDVLAPGSHIRSCNAFYRRQRSYYIEKSGTSMATPVVAGAVAAYLSKYPNETNANVKLQLKNTCHVLPWYPYQQGWGMLHVTDLLKEKIPID